MLTATNRLRMSRNSVVAIIIKFADRNSPILVRISLPLQGFQQILCEEAMFELSEFERNFISLGCCSLSFPIGGLLV